jgi:hypothetical protein
LLPIRASAKETEIQLKHGESGVDSTAAWRYPAALSHAAGEKRRSEKEEVVFPTVTVIKEQK